MSKVGRLPTLRAIEEQVEDLQQRRDEIAAKADDRDARLGELAAAVQLLVAEERDRAERAAAGPLSMVIADQVAVHSGKWVTNGLVAADPDAAIRADVELLQTLIYAHNLADVTRLFEAAAGAIIERLRQLGVQVRLDRQQ